MRHLMIFSHRLKKNVTICYKEIKGDHMIFSND